MEERVRGQFYMVGAIMIMLYLIFITQTFMKIYTKPELPSLVSPENIFLVFQEIADEGGDTEEKVDVLLEALKYSSEYLAISCLSNATGEEACLLPEAHWKCGVTVSASMGAREYARASRFIQSRAGFFANFSRIPIFISSNTTANLVKISVDVGVENPLVVDDGRVLRVSCSSTNCSFRINVKDVPKVVYIYNTTGNSGKIFENIGIISGENYNGGKIAEELETLGHDYENISVEELSELKGNAGPVILFIPGTYPEIYGEELKEYVKNGGTLVSVLGLCSNSTMECIVGNIEKIEDEHSLLNASGFEAPLGSTNSEYFAEVDLPLAVYYSTEANYSRAAIGGIRYGEGWIFFVGNESMLTEWDGAKDLVKYVVRFALPPLSLYVKACEVQKA